MLAQHVLADLALLAGTVTQLRYPVRVGQEPRVQHEVGVRRQPVLEAEGEHGHPQPARVLPAEQLLHPAAQLVHVDMGGVDQYVGLPARLHQQLPLGGDAVGEPPVAL